MTRRSRTPIFDALAQRYQERPQSEPPRLVNWADRAWMRGVLYGIVLQGITPPKRQRVLCDPAPPFSEPWHVTYPSPWDATDVVPNEHHPDL